MLYAKLLVFSLCLLPALSLLYRFFTQQLGAEPVETLLHESGDWGFRLLLVTLALTPLRLITGQSVWIRFRRMLGLYAFFYASMHLSIYLALEHFFDWAEIWKDFVKRPYITVGILAWLLLLPLALTSLKALQKRMGRRWKQLHQLVYVIGMLVVFHYLWLVKKDLLEPLVYGVIFLLLLGVRVWDQRRRSSLSS